jgi:hypothetical protein
MMVESHHAMSCRLYLPQRESHQQGHHRQRHSSHNSVEEILIEEKNSTTYVLTWQRTKSE